MERREFCRLAAVCAFTAGCTGLSGCARMLDWSESRRATPQAREFKGGQGADASLESSATTPSADGGSPSAAAPPASPPPDLSVWRGSDPAANVRAAIDALGGMGRFVKPGARVALKPNILTARAPEYAVTTNPAVMAALVRLAFEAGAADVVAFDRPTSTPRNAYEVSGIAAAVEGAGGRMKVLTDRDFERIAIPDGKALASWPFAVPAFEADVFINVPIAKTHGLAVLTMAMKNLMGILGGIRGTIHQDFTQKIVDVNSIVKPTLVVLDAYRILTANGPSGGDLADVKETRTVVVGTNQVSVDAYGTRLFGMAPTDLAYLRRAAEQGLGVIDVAKLNVAEGTS